jgi:hypothetical protein
MAHEEKIAEYRRQRLGGREIPADLRALLVLQWQRGSADAGADPLEAMGVTLLDPGESHDLLDHSYLNATDRANPDIMANVAAMQITCEHAVFVARDEDGALIGYWLGPENVGIGAAPILKLDSEGQFALLEGATLSEGLLGNHVFEDTERFAELKAAFAKVGIAIKGDSWDDLPYPKAPTDPGVYHEKRYVENRNKAGLPPYR